MALVKTELFFKQNVTQQEIDKLYEKIEQEQKSNQIGYYDLVFDKDNIIKKIEKFSTSKDLSKIDNIVIIGVGGSSLGIKAIDSMLSHTKNRNSKNLIFLENVDPIDISKKSKNLTLKNSLFIVISKSGSTIETTSILKYLIAKFKLSCSDDLRLKEHFVFITDLNSPLDLWAKSENITVFHIPLNVGGRFSILSAVGLFPLSILGYDIKALLDGAKVLRESFFNKNEDQIIKKALHYVKNRKDQPINILFSYSNSLKHFNDWYIQLWAESLGKIDKNGNRVALTPIGLIGSIDQHSFLQLIIEGTKDKSVTMIKIKNFQNGIQIPDIKLPNLSKLNFINNRSFQTLINAQCDATMRSILDQKIDIDLIEIEYLSEQSVGYMIYYYELLTSLCGILLNINTYNQPGVEYGKKILKERFE